MSVSLKINIFPQMKDSHIELQNVPCGRGADTWSRAGGLIDTQTEREIYNFRQISVRTINKKSYKNEFNISRGMKLQEKNIPLFTYLEICKIFINFIGRKM